MRESRFLSNLSLVSLGQPKAIRLHMLLLKIHFAFPIVSRPYITLVQLILMSACAQTNGSYPYTSAIPNGTDTNGAITVPLGSTNQPTVLVRSLTESETTFHLSGAELSLANSLRRVMQAEVPTVGKYHDLSLFTMEGGGANGN